MTGITIDQNDQSFRIESGEFVVVTGPSGSGKSTLLQDIRRQRGVEFDDPNADIEFIFNEHERGLQHPDISTFRQHCTAWAEIVFCVDPDVVLIDEIDSGNHDLRDDKQEALRLFRNAYDGTVVCVTLDYDMTDFGDKLIEL